MGNLPATLARVLACFAPAFSRRIWRRIQVLLVGAILAPGARTVTAVLRVVGLAQDSHFPSYHQVLSRSRWSPRALSRILLRLLLKAFVPEGEPVVCGLDETLERRRGKKILAKGLYRDATRSSRAVHVRSHGLRWVSLMLLGRIPWAHRVWALPFLTVLAPSARYCEARARRYKTRTEWGRQMLVQLRRWLPKRALVVVADHNYAALELLDRARRLDITVITRMQLRAALYDEPPSYADFRRQHPQGRYPKKGARQPPLSSRLTDPETVWHRVELAWYNAGVRTMELATGVALWNAPGRPIVPIRWVLVRDPEGRAEPQALLCTAPELTAEQLLRYFLLRWQVEVTFEELHAHLGLETQRQWSDLAIRRTTPLLFGLFSLITLFAHALQQTGGALPARRAAWYPKVQPTFSDALALVRLHLWPHLFIEAAASEPDAVLIPRRWLQHLTETLAFAA